MPKKNTEIPSTVEIIQTGKKGPKPAPNKPMHQKICSKCGRRQTIQEFYTNRLYITQLGRDRWCRACIKSECYDAVTFRQYMYENNRAWSDDLWQESLRLAAGDLNLSPAFISLEKEEDRIREIDRRAVAHATHMMNDARFYKYMNNESTGFEMDVKKQMESEMTSTRRMEDPYYNLKIYSPEWRGSYTQHEIDDMNKYLNSIITSRGAEDEIAIKYAKQFVAQSALVDALAEKQRNDPTKENIEAYQKAISSLETISKAGQIAPAYKKTETAAGLGSLGEFIKLMENAQLLTPKREYEPDHIDAILKDLRQTVAAVNGAGGLWG